MLRKKILMVLFVVYLALNGCAEGRSRPAPPFRTLFSNDMTNITTCCSPYSPAGTPFRLDGLHGSVDETVGVGIDVHFLQPAFGWVALWKSDTYPYDKQHSDWLMQEFGIEPSCYGRYMLQGGDIVGDFVERCREKGMKTFISLRMNDHHRMENVPVLKELMSTYGASDSSFQFRRNWGNPDFFVRYRDMVDNRMDLSVSRVKEENPEYRLGYQTAIPERGDMELWDYVRRHREELRVHSLWNWAMPGARQHKLDFVTEICEQYDIDGFELDFMRRPPYFSDDTPMDERQEIMTAFIRKVRDVLDRTAKEGQYRWLSVRVPFRLPALRAIGVDVKDWHDAGVDIFNLSCHWPTEQQHDLARIHLDVPEAPLYIELTHAAFNYRPVGENNVTVMATPNMLYTTAHLAYSRGAQGIYSFNFAYYRHYGRKLTEPPFEIFKVLRDPDLVAQQPQHYFLTARDYNGKRFRQRPGQNFSETFVIDMAPPKGGWMTDGKLRILMTPTFPNVPCDVYFNGIRLKKNTDISSPYSTELDEDFGCADSVRAWTLPKSILQDGVNNVRVDLPHGIEGALMVCLDIAIK